MDITAIPAPAERPSLDDYPRDERSRYYRDLDAWWASTVGLELLSRVDDRLDERLDATTLVQFCSECCAGGSPLGEPVRGLDSHRECASDGGTVWWARLVEQPADLTTDTASDESTEPPVESVEQSAPAAEAWPPHRWVRLPEGATIALLVGAILVSALPSGQTASASPARSLTNSVDQVNIAPASAGVPTPVTIRLGPGTTDPAVLDVIVGFDPVTTIPFHDDGLGGDAVAGDGLLTAVIPAQPAETLVRHRVRVGAGTTEVVVPVKDGKRRYDGFVIDRPAVVTQLPLLDWYLSPADAQWLANNRASKTYVPAVLVVGSRVIDGVEVRNQGGFTSGFSPKPNYKFKLPGQQVIDAPFFDLPVDEFVADADYEDPTSAIGIAAWNLQAAAGVPVRQASTARLERNGSFYGVYQLYQEHDGTWVDQLPYPITSHYESQSGGGRLIDEGSPALLADQWEQVVGSSSADLEALVAAVDGRAGPARVDAIVDRFDVPRLIDMLAMSALMQHTDVGTTNLELLAGADGRWRVVPNDLDLTLGLRGQTRVPALLPLPLTGTTLPLWADGELAQQVARRIRTHYEEWFATDRILDDVRARVTLMEDDLILDRAAWQLSVPTPAVGLLDLEDFLVSQRATMSSWTADGLLPAAGTESTAVRISELSAAGTTGDFVEIANADPARSVDLSGWRIDGAAVADLPGGTVLAAGARLVVPLAPAEMAAPERGVLVSGRLDAPLPPSGGTLVLRDETGQAHDDVTWSTGTGWPQAGSTGRSIEALTLDAGRLAGPGWALSPEAGGTPGEAGASASGLSIVVSAPVVADAADAGTPLRIVVANAGPGARTDVVLDGPTGDCDRNLPDLAEGATRVVTCAGPVLVPEGVKSLRSTVRSDEEPGGAFDAALVVRMATSNLPVPTITGLRLDDAAIGVRTTTFGPMAVNSTSPWRVESRFEPDDGGEAVAMVVGSPSTGSIPVAGGRSGATRLTVRGADGFTSMSGSAPSITARPTEVWPFASSGALVDRWYRDLAGRPPTTTERADWTSTIGGSGGPADLAVSLLASDRWAGKVDPIVRAYLAHFGRLPDIGGLRHWVNKRRSGWSLVRINQSFANSSEFERRYAGLSTSDVVAAIYQNVFGRAPDSVGLSYWTGRINGGTSVATVVLAFSESSEGVRRKAPTVAGVVTWFAFYDALPSPSWLAEAVSWVDGGGDRATLVELARSRSAYAQVVD